MKGYNYIVIVLLLAAGLLAGCAHEEELTLQNEIAVTTGVTGMQRRASSIDDATLQTKDIKIDAYFHDTETKYLDGKKLHYTGTTPPWQFWGGTPAAQEHYYWPFEGSKVAGGDVIASTLDFVGACPYDISVAGYEYIESTSYATGTGTSFTCDVTDYMTNARQASMNEYLIAVLDSQTLKTQTDAGGALPMQFKHPFALIKFVIAAASGEHVTVDSIGIGGLHTDGTCTYDGTTMTWGDYSGSADMKILPAHELKYNTAYTTSPTMMVIPKNYGELTLSVRASWDDWSVVENQTISANVNFNWEPGYSYTYNLTVTPYALKVDISKFTEQW